RAPPRSTTGCGTRTSCRPTPRRSTSSWSRTRTSSCASPSWAGTTTGRSSPRASSPRPDRTPSPTTRRGAPSSSTSGCSPPSPMPPASFVADAGPVPCADPRARSPELVNLGVIAPLDDRAPLADITADRFQEGLQELWSDQEGTRYGIPKDYDTVAVMYDKN